jgi:hypothetical protein
MTAAPLDPALTMSQDPPRVVDSYELNEFLVQGRSARASLREKAGASQFLFEYESVQRLTSPPRPPSIAAVSSI